MSDTIRLFVGTSAGGEDAEAEMVLEYTARKHCSSPLDITWMRQAKSGPWSNWLSCKRNRTPFSSFRWGVPAVCDFMGKAIYSDVDFFFRADLAELWRQDIPSVGLVRNPRGKLTTACILFDCAKAKGHVPSLDALRKMSDAHDDMLQYFRAKCVRDDSGQKGGKCTLLDAFEGNWECTDFEKDVKQKGDLSHPDIKAIHYTRMEQQLHLKYAIPRLRAAKRQHWYVVAGAPVFDHPRKDLQAEFDTLYQEALAAGYTVDQYRGDPSHQAERRGFSYSSHVGATR